MSCSNLTTDWRTNALFDAAPEKLILYTWPEYPRSATPLKTAFPSENSHCATWLPVICLERHAHLSNYCILIHVLLQNNFISCIHGGSKYFQVDCHSLTVPHEQSNCTPQLSSGDKITIRQFIFRGPLKRAMMMHNFSSNHQGQQVSQFCQLSGSPSWLAVETVLINRFVE